MKVQTIASFSLETFAITCGYGSVLLYTSLIAGCFVSYGKLITASECMDSDPGIQISFMVVLFISSLGNLFNVMATSSYVDNLNLYKYSLVFMSGWFTMCSIMISLSQHRRAHMICIGIGVLLMFILTLSSRQWMIAFLMFVFVCLSANSFAIAELLLFELVLYRVIDGVVKSAWCKVDLINRE